MKRQPAKKQRTKITRRVAVGVVAFESYGIERGDRAIVAMTGDVRVGELGYFETGSYVGGNRCPRRLRSHRWFAFLCDQDAACYEWIERGKGICLRRRLDRCEGEHGAEPYDDIPSRETDSQQPGGVLIESFGRVVSVERNNEEVETSLALRTLDEREEATTSIACRGASERRPAGRATRDLNPLPSLAQRMQLLTREQHEEIARLIHSSMEVKRPKPELTHQGRIVVRREVTTLARVAGVRRLLSHSTTFRRALTQFERDIEHGECSRADERAGRLAIEHLWRWLHGYTKPLEEWQKLPQRAERLRALLDGDNLEETGLMMIELPCDMPSESLRKGAMVMVQQGAPIPSGSLGLVRVPGKLALGRIFQLDPNHVRVGIEGGDIYTSDEVEFVGPVVSGSCEFIPLDKADTAAAVAMFNSAFPDAMRPAKYDDEWPDVIGEA